MAFQLSPGVNVTEIDLTTVVPAVATNDGAFAGVFRWGPIDERVFITNENELATRFGKPTNLNPETFFTAANFLSYTNRLYISRAANTTGETPVVTGNTTGSANAIVQISNTSALQVGMYLTQCSNLTITFGNSVVNSTTLSTVSIVSKNSSSIELSKTVAAPQANVQFYFGRPTTAYTAVGFDSANNNAVAANLVNQIVKNENHYIQKDGSFDTDVIYLAKYPGAIGNSLRVGVCDTANSFQSNVVLSNSTINTAVEFRFGSNVGLIKFLGSANGSANDVSDFIALGDQVLAGNSTIGLQYLKVTSITVSNLATTANVLLNIVNSTSGDINFRTNFITTSSNSSNYQFTNNDILVYVSGNNLTSNITANTTGYSNTNDVILLSNTAEYSVGRRVYYGVPTGNTAIGGLTGNSFYYISFSNSTAIALSTTDGGSNVDITANNLTNPAEVHTLTFSNTVGGLTNGNSYYVIEANSSGFKLSETPFGTEVDLSYLGDHNPKFVANTNVLSLGFEDPYRLRSPYISNVVSRNWEFFNVVDNPPGQSNFQLYNGNTSAQDELHVVVVDEKGEFTGTPGTILEVFKGLSRATNAVNDDGTDNYYKNIINQSSRYIWWTADRSTALSNTALNLTSATSGEPASIQFKLGADGHSEANASLSILGQAYDLFQSPEDIDISLVLQGKPIGGTTVVDGRTVQNFNLANYLIDNIVGGSSFDPENKNGRRDCVAFVSPDRATVLNNIGDEALDLKAWRGAVHSSSYAVMDSGYKYQYDRYNDVYRWIPLNGDIAGLCARTDITNDSWWSPAGFNRGQIKNLVKLAYNPKKPERDILYPAGINPVVTFPGEGTVLYGDKTLQAKPSAFDRINVRRLFITLEKAISTAAKYSLFEFNDAFTRAQFRNLVIPYLRTVKGRRGITDFLVVCDDTNNTPQIIDSNQFVGDIYIKPARSINFIQLNFIAVPTGVQFSEVIGKF